MLVGYDKEENKWLRVFGGLGWYNDWLWNWFWVRKGVGIFVGEVIIVKGGLARRRNRELGYSKVGVYGVENR